MKHKGGWSFIEIYNLPVGLRKWFFNRMIKQYQDEAEEMKKS